MSLSNTVYQFLFHLISDFGNYKISLKTSPKQTVRITVLFMLKRDHRRTRSKNARLTYWFVGLKETAMETVLQSKDTRHRALA